MRLIDADALGIGKAKREVFEVPEYADGWNSAIEMIENAPTIEAKPVVHAHWINDPAYKSFDGKWKKGQECSACGAYFVSDAIKPYSNHPYCSECGAQMDEVVE